MTESRPKSREVRKSLRKPADIMAPYRLLKTIFWYPENTPSENNRPIYVDGKKIELSMETAATVLH
jgi:hypothetical protein